MEEKNPYENHETVDIPDFSSIKSDDEEIDRSIFKMNDAEDEESEEVEDDEEYEDEEPSYKKVRSSVVVIAGIVMAVLLVISIFSIVWGISKKNAYSSLKSEYDAYVTTSKQQITDLNTKITELQTQINNNSSSNSSTSGDSTSAATYKVSNALTVPLKLRTGAGTSNSQVKYDDLSEDLKKIATEDEGYAFVTNNATFAVTETKDDSDGNTWGKIADNVWVCLVYGGETWCAKQ